MRMMGEIFAIPFMFGLLATGIPTLGFVLISLFDGWPKLRLRQIAGMVAIAAAVFGIFSAGPHGEGAVFFILSVVLFLIFFVMWRNEFRLFMLRRDDEFPGRWDKLGWFIMLTLGAPAGVWLFRAFRQSRWPEPVSGAGHWVHGATATHAKVRTSPWDDDEAVTEASPVSAGVE
jgi:hypothetical protein